MFAQANHRRASLTSMAPLRRHTDRNPTKRGHPIPTAHPRRIPSVYRSTKDVGCPGQGRCSSFCRHKLGVHTAGRFVGKNSTQPLRRNLTFCKMPTCANAAHESPSDKVQPVCLFVTCSDAVRWLPGFEEDRPTVSRPQTHRPMRSCYLARFDRRLCHRRLPRQHELQGSKTLLTTPLALRALGSQSLGGSPT